MIEQAADVCARLNAEAKWIRSKVFEPLGTLKISPQDAHKRLEKKVPQLREVVSLGSARGYRTFTLRPVIGGGMGVIVEIMPAYPSGYVVGALKDSNEYSFGLCWAGTIQLSVAVEAYVGIEFALWNCKPEDLTGWFSMDSFELAVILGIKGARYSREGTDTLAYAFTPLMGAAVKMERVEPDDPLGGGGIVAWLPGRMLDRITAR